MSQLWPGSYYLKGKDMRYFKNPVSEKVHAYDETVPSQLPYMDIAIKDNWVEVTGSWPPPPPCADLGSTSRRAVDRHRGYHQHSHSRAVW